jgi:hypothetical protein
MKTIQWRAKEEGCIDLYDFYGCKTNPSHCPPKASDREMILLEHIAPNRLSRHRRTLTSAVPTATGEAFLEEDSLPSRRRHLILRFSPPGDTGPHISACSSFSSPAGLALRRRSCSERAYVRINSIGYAQGVPVGL